jgi:hypothetical protein
MSRCTGPGATVTAWRRRKRKDAGSKNRVAVVASSEREHPRRVLGWVPPAELVPDRPRAVENRITERPPPAYVDNMKP